MQFDVSSIHGFNQTHGHYVKVMKRIQHLKNNAVVECLVLHIWEVRVRASGSEPVVRIFVPFLVLSNLFSNSLQFTIPTIILACEAT
jgi:hypothetical protein